MAMWMLWRDDICVCVCVCHHHQPHSVFNIKHLIFHSFTSAEHKLSFYFQWFLLRRFWFQLNKILKLNFDVPALSQQTQCQSFTIFASACWRWQLIFGILVGTGPGPGPHNTMAVAIIFTAGILGECTEAPYRPNRQPIATAKKVFFVYGKCSSAILDEITFLSS